MSKSEKEDEASKPSASRTSARKRAARARTPSEAPKAPVPEQEPSAQPEARAKPQPETEATVPEEATTAAAAEAAEPTEQLPTLDANGALSWCISFLTAQAWQWMGLMADPLSGTVKKDLEQARLLIDSVAALTETLAAKSDATQRRELQNNLSNLRINFVSQSQTAPP